MWDGSYSEFPKAAQGSCSQCSALPGPQLLRHQPSLDRWGLARTSGSAGLHHSFAGWGKPECDRCRSAALSAVVAGVASPLCSRLCFCTGRLFAHCYYSSLVSQQLWPPFTPQRPPRVALVFSRSVLIAVRVVSRPVVQQAHLLGDRGPERGSANRPHSVAQNQRDELPPHLLRFFICQASLFPLH
ncbi:hypothetical protein NDU88_010744 [Pleurodeles waltl]|uniref:Uncharacterized protein n=1 Tax=Pleurodeles waltl TaxID=8319 RepID=A0AAV7QZ37_PLEWA|nr:hypothetical protein NDU88_010744 [Pleurodeles waltl]